MDNPFPMKNRWAVGVKDGLIVDLLPQAPLGKRDPGFLTAQGIDAQAVALVALRQCLDDVEEDVAHPPDVRGENLEDFLV